MTILIQNGQVINPATGMNEVADVLVENGVVSKIEKGIKEKADRKINAKSLLGVLSMGITKGTRISIIAEGPDEEEAVKALTEMLVKEIF